MTRTPRANTNSNGALRTACDAVVLDGRSARRLHLSRTPRGSLHVEELARLDEVWDEKAHHRTSKMSAHGRSLPNTRHEREERLQRFARDVGAWLGHAPAVDGLLPVLCTAAMLGALREVSEASLLRRLDFHECDLVRLQPAELAAHPTIIALLPLAAG